MSELSLDLRAARRRFERAASTYAAAAVLPREVERRMGERLQYIRCDPARVLDAGCGTGEGLMLLREHYPRAEAIGLDFAWPMARAAAVTARAAHSMLDRARAFISGAATWVLCADLACLPLARASVGAVWSNLALAWMPDPRPALLEFARVLEPRGLLMFSSYGPDTLKELRRAFAGVDGYAHVHRFLDMHDLGDMLLAAGFAEPVMDMEAITLTYSAIDALARDLRRSGQTNADSGRRRGLMTHRAWARLAAAYETTRADGRVPATFEIVYGHAWRGEPRERADGGRVVKTDFDLRKRAR